MKSGSIKPPLIQTVQVLVELFGAGRLAQEAADIAIVGNTPMTKVQTCYLRGIETSRYC